MRQHRLARRRHRFGSIDHAKQMTRADMKTVTGFDLKRDPMRSLMIENNFQGAPRIQIQRVED